MIKKQFKKLIEKSGYRIIKKDAHILVGRTSKKDVNSLISKLFPYQTDKNLIRLGPNSDGGYLIPDDIEDIKACFSPGVDNISDFEQECINRGMKVFMADKSVEKPNLSIPTEQYNFIKKHIGCTNNQEFMTMDKWVNSSDLKSDEDLLLQMDIEGGEYYSLINISDSLLKRFRILVIEFHFLQDLWNPHFFNMAEAVFNKILQTHSCVHIHPNNCCGIDSQFGIEIPRVAEFTFLRNDRADFKKHQIQFPHKLDFDNTKKDSITLPKNWYKSL